MLRNLELCLRKANAEDFSVVFLSQVSNEQHFLDSNFEDDLMCQISKPYDCCFCDEQRTVIL